MNSDDISASNHSLTPDESDSASTTEGLSGEAETNAPEQHILIETGESGDVSITVGEDEDIQFVVGDKVIGVSVGGEEYAIERPSDDRFGDASDQQGLESDAGLHGEGTTDPPE